MRTLRVKTVLCVAALLAMAQATATHADPPATSTPADDPSGWSGLSFAEFADLVVATACSPAGRAAKGLSPQMVDYACMHYLDNSSMLATASPDAIFRMLSAVLVKLPKAHKAEFAKRYYSVVLPATRPAEQIKGEELVLLGWTLISSGLYAQDQSFPEFARAVAAHVRDGQDFGDDVRKLQVVPVPQPTWQVAGTTYLSPFWYADIRTTLDDNACPFYRGLYSTDRRQHNYSACYFFGKALGTDADRQVLRNELVVQECGCPRMGPAQVLTWAYRRLDKLDEWRSFLDGKVADRDLQDEARAKWFIVRGYADEADGYLPNPWAGERWLEKAIVASHSEQVQQECLDAIALNFGGEEKFADGIAYLRSVQPSLATGALQALDECLQLQLAEAQARAAKSVQTSHDEEEQNRRQGRLAALTSELAAAEASGASPARVAALKTAIAELSGSAVATEPSR